MPVMTHPIWSVSLYKCPIVLASINRSYIKKYSTLEEMYAYYTVQVYKQVQHLVGNTGLNLSSIC